MISLCPDLIILVVWFYQAFLSCPQYTGFSPMSAIHCTTHLFPTASRCRAHQCLFFFILQEAFHFQRRPILRSLSAHHARAALAVFNTHQSSFFGIQTPITSNCVIFQSYVAALGGYLDFFLFLRGIRGITAISQVLL